MIPAIIISSHTVGLGVTRALGAMGVPIISLYYDDKDMGFVSKYVTESIFIAHPTSNEQQFIKDLVQCHKTVGRALLVPADDATLVAVSRSKDLLSKYFIVACPDYSITRCLIEKKYTYALAEKLGIAAPKTSVPTSLKDVEAFLRTAEFPCLVKPCQSHLYVEKFGHKMVQVSHPRELLDAYQEAEAAGIEVMLQEYIPGDEGAGANYNSYLWDGKALVEFTASKVRISPPEFGVPSVVISREIGEVLDPGRKILRGLGYYGFSCAEFKRDPRDGVYKFLEVNGRHNRSTLLAVNCGINFPWLEYRHLVQGQLPSASEFRQDVYWIDEFHDLNRCISQLGRGKTGGKVGISKYLAPYLGRHVYAVFDKDDMKPFFRRGVNLVKQLLNL